MTATAPGVPSAAPTPAKLAGEDLVRVEHLKMYFPVTRGIVQRRVGWIRAVDDVTFTVRRRCGRA